MEDGETSPGPKDKAALDPRPDDLSLEEQVKFWRERALKAETANEALERENKRLRALSGISNLDLPSPSLDSSTDGIEGGLPAQSVELTNSVETKLEQPAAARAMPPRRPSSLPKFEELESATTPRRPSRPSSGPNLAGFEAELRPRRPSSRPNYSEFEDLFRSTSTRNLTNPSDNVAEETLVVEGGEVKAATVQRLVERLTSEIDTPINVDTFLLMYRSFLTPNELVGLLISRYNASQSKPIEQKVVHVFSKWVTNHWKDLSKDKLAKEKAEDFLKVVAPSHSKEIQPILDSIRKQPPSAEEGERKPTLQRRPTSQTVLLSNHPNWVILNESPSEIARQLTLLDWAHWSKIESTELFGLAWMKQSKSETSPNVVAMTQWFNTVSSWVVAAVCTTENNKLRVKVIQQFLLVLDELRAMGNFNGFMAVLSGLDRGPVYRMRRTMDEIFVQKTLMSILSDAKALASPAGNNANLRKAMNALSPPLIPYLGMYLTDITFLEEGNRDPREGMINYRRCNFLAVVIKRIRQTQSMGYSFAPKPDLQDSLSRIEQIDDDTLYDLSQYLEPKEGKSPKNRPPFLDTLKSKEKTPKKTASTEIDFEGLSRGRSAGSFQRREDYGNKRLSSQARLEDGAKNFEAHIRFPIGNAAFNAALASPDDRRALQFCTDIESLKVETDRNQILHECQRIYAKYFATTAATRLALPETLMSDLKDSLRISFSKGMYDPISRHLRSTHLDGPWIAYAASPAFEAAMSQIIIEHASSTKKEKFISSTELKKSH